jgi:CRP-like cAMP-binding protein
MNRSNARRIAPSVRPNALLSVLSSETSERFAAKLVLVDLPSGAILDPKEHAERYAYFPNDALISLLSVIENGKSAEVGIVGAEGLIGLEGMFGGKNPYVQPKVQSAGTAFRVPARLLRHEFQRNVDMRRLILGYMHSMISQIAQAAICYRHHSIEQQLCRKLLMSSDRLGRDELALTQSTIADLLGVRREGVTAAAGALRKLGVIDYRRGQIHILDRARLKERSCECYAALHAQNHLSRRGGRPAGGWPTYPDFAPTAPAAVAHHMQARA